MNSATYLAFLLLWWDAIKAKPLAGKVLDEADKLSLEESDNNGDIFLFTVVKPGDILLRSSRIKPEGKKVKCVAFL